MYHEIRLEEEQQTDGKRNHTDNSDEQTHHLRDDHLVRLSSVGIGRPVTQPDCKDEKRRCEIECCPGIECDMAVIETIPMQNSGNSQQRGKGCHWQKP